MVMSKKEMGKLIKNARRIKSKRTGKRYTQEMLANDLNLSRGYIGDIENGRTYPNYVLLSKISEICEVPLSYFDENIENQLFTATSQEIREPNTLRGQTSIYALDKDYALSVVGEREYGYIENKFIEVPVFRGITPKTSLWACDDVYIYESIPIDMANGGKYFGLLAPDNSMDSARICEGDTVIVREQAEASDNDIVVILVGNRDALIRKYNKSGDNVILLPLTTRKEYDIETIDTKQTNIRILGKVIKFIGRV